MAFTTLAHANALNPGSDIWIVPAIAESHWAGKIDWYLNFQIGKSSRHVLPQISDSLQEILTQTETPILSPDHSSESLLIAANQRLPCRWVVVLPVQDNMAKWIQSIHTTWVGLGKAPLRVFLAPNLSTASFQLTWKNHDEQDDLTLILD